MNDLEKLEALTEKLQHNRRMVFIGSCILCFVLGTLFGIYLVFQRGTLVQMEAVETKQEEQGVTL